MHYRKFIAFLLLIFGLSFPVFAGEVSDGWYLSTFMGGSMSAPNYLRFHLKDFPDQKINAVYANKNFSDSHWWAFRLEKMKGDKLRGFEMVHHKIYLANTNDVIQDFSISDGYNLIYHNWGKKYGKNRVRFGAGVVLGHPDVTMPGRQRFHTKGPTGHFLAGPTIQFNYQRWLYETKTHFVSVDTKLTLSYARTTVSVGKGEYVEAPDIALHLSLGFGSKPEAIKRTGLYKIDYFAPLVYPYIVGNYVLGTSIVP